MAWMLPIQPSARSEMITSTVVSPVPSTTMLSPWPGSRCSKGCHGSPIQAACPAKVSDPGSAAGGSLPVAKTTRSASTAVESARRMTTVSPARFDVQDLARDKLRRDRGHAVRALQMMVHDGPQIVAVHHAWNEALAQLDFRHS